ncbi:restriction endonuclease subunit S [Helicobacter pylori]|uniref:restriction endonuclease subunit S n=1 Tax=Helicobacter pylori TaxID=210 RepID=UPI000BBB00B5|nr:restriction endonuclease subunit S [Helicobacter pylori]
MDALMLPLNWQRVRLGDIGKPCMCKRVMKHQTTRYGEIPFYKIGTFGNTADAFISKKLFLEYKTKYSFPKKGDILISDSGTIGRAVIYDGKPAYFQDSNIVWIDNDETLVKNDFLFYAYSNVKWNTEHTTILRLYNDNFRNTLIPLPPLNEQSTIANILSGLDRYLCALDALILKKEDVKKALSFELLSQRKRLKGFNQAWQRVRLGDILELLTDYHANGSYELLKNNVTLLKHVDFAIMIRTTNFENNDFKNDLIYINKKAYEFLSKSKVFAGDILVNKIANAGTAYFMPKLNQPVSLGMNLFLLRIKPNYNNFFIFKQIANYERVLKTFANGSATKTITKNVIKNLLIPLPPLNEQSAIANILSDLDNEITSLKNKKRQFENIKKALNHDLMSAKIRVLEK